MVDSYTIVLACYSLQIMFGSLTIATALMLGNALHALARYLSKTERRKRARAANLAAWRNRRAMRILRNS